MNFRSQPPALLLAIEREVPCYKELGLRIPGRRLDPILTTGEKAEWCAVLVLARWGGIQVPVRFSEGWHEVVLTVG